MSNAESLKVAILVGRTVHPEKVIDDFWSRASQAVIEDRRILSVTAVYVGTHDISGFDTRDSLVVQRISAPQGRALTVFSRLGSKPGPVGMLGRLLHDYFYSKDVAKTFKARKDLVSSFSRSDIVVAADLAADRAVWGLQKISDASLQHGPMAMLHVIRQLVRQ